MAMAGAALAALVWRGVVDSTSVLLALVLAPFFFAGVCLGSRVFPYIDERRFRRYTLIFLIVMSTIALGS